MWANLSLGQAIKFAIYFAWWNLKPLPNLLDLYPKKNYLFLIRHHFKRSLSLISLYLKELKVLFLFLVNSKILEGYYLLFYFSFSSLSCTNYFYFVSQKKKNYFYFFCSKNILFFLLSNFITISMQESWPWIFPHRPADITTGSCKSASFSHSQNTFLLSTNKYF